MTLTAKLQNLIQNRQSFASGFFGTALKMSAVRALIIVLSFVGSVALTRSIGPEGRGLIAWFIAAASISMMFAQGGIEVLSRRFIAEDKSLAGGMTVLTVTMCFVGTLLVTPFYLYFAIVNGIGRDHVAMLVVANISIFFMALAPSLNGVQLGLDQVREFMWGTTLQKVCNVVLVLALIVVGWITPLGGLLALMISYILQIGMALYSLQRYVKQRKPGAFAFVMKKKSYMFYSYIRNILMMTASAILPLMLGSQHSLSSAGWFAACTIIIDAINKTFSMISTYALPQIAGAKSHIERDKLKKNVQLLSFWGMLAIAVVWMAIAGWAIPLILGSEFSAAVNTFRILCVYMVFSSLSDANQAITMAATEKSMIIWPPLAMLIAVSAIAWMLIPTQGANGAAIALLGGSFVMMVVSWLCARRVRSFNTDKLLAPEIDPEDNVEGF